MTQRAFRQAARVVVLDAEGDVLLVRYEELLDPTSARPQSYWVPPGGGLAHGESHRAAVARELEEETGLAPEIGPLLWERACTYRFEGRFINQHERFYLARLDAVRPAVANRTPEPIVEHRWWTVADVRRSSERFFPHNLGELLGPVVRGKLPEEPLRI